MTELESMIERGYSDEKDHLPVRSDTIILLRLDPGAGQTAVMSIPRDLKVRIPGHGIGKINAAYADGGPKLSVATVKQLFGVMMRIHCNAGDARRTRAGNRECVENS